MSSSFEKLDFIIEKIEDIESFKARYKSIEDLLNDVKRNKLVQSAIVKMRIDKAQAFLKKNLKQSLKKRR